MITILHAADLHLDSAFSGRGEGATARLRAALRSVPEQICAICARERCDLLLLSGDVFDGAPTAESLRLLKQALGQVDIPVFIAPGNHDFYTPNSPWVQESWPENVHIFTRPVVESIALAERSCRIYGAAFTSMDCAPLLENFSLEGDEKYHIALLHGDPLLQNSPYNPITQAQVRGSGLDYLALGHVHKQGSFHAGKTLCAWPGCAMGRGYDELGEKGVLLVTVADNVSTRFIPLNTPRFYDVEAEVETTAEAAIAARLPAVANEDFYRITLIGECETPDLSDLTNRFSQFPNLELRDHTRPSVDLWACAGSDSLEGVYFGMLKDALQEQDEQSRRIILLAAKISRKILDGEEVVLP